MFYKLKRASGFLKVGDYIDVHDVQKDDLIKRDIIESDGVEENPNAPKQEAETGDAEVSTTDDILVDPKTKEVMRKFLIVAVMCLAGIAAHAQNNTAIMTNPNGLALDTASQAAARGAVYRAPGANKVLSIVVKTTKISGTVAGTVSWQGSNDPAGSTASFGTISTTALVDATGVTNYVYKEVDQGYLWYRALITQTGTSSLSYTDYLHFSPAK